MPKKLSRVESSDLVPAPSCTSAQALTGLEAGQEGATGTSSPTAAPGFPGSPKAPSLGAVPDAPAGLGGASQPDAYNVWPVLQSQETGPEKHQDGDPAVNLATGSSDRFKGVRALTGVTVDGGTKLSVKLERLNHPPAMAQVLDAIREGEKGSGVCHLPLPQLDLFDHNEGSAGAEYTVSGRESQCVTFHVRDRVYVTANLRTGRVCLQLKAKGMWAAGGGARGYATMVRKWLPAVHWMMTGESISLETCHRNGDAGGWNMTGLELCVDYLGLDFRTDDLGNFLHVRTTAERRSFKERENLAQYSKDGLTAQTIELGKRKGNQLSACLYRKLEEIQSKKQGDDSTYAPIWRKLGWDGEEEITRVEFRMANKGLVFTDGETGEVLNFRDPMTATSEDNLRTLWGIVAYKRRLVTGLQETRRLAGARNVSRLPTDKRWVEIQKSSQLDLDLGADWKQERAVQKATQAFREAKAEREAVQGTARTAALRGVDVSTLDDAAYGAFCIDARRGYKLQGKDLRAYVRDYRTSQCGFIELEIAARRAPTLEVIDATTAALKRQLERFEPRAA